MRSLEYLKSRNLIEHRSEFESPRRLDVLVKNTVVGVELVGCFHHFALRDHCVQISVSVFGSFITISLLSLKRFDVIVLPQPRNRKAVQSRSSPDRADRHPVGKVFPAGGKTPLEHSVA